ncbi:MAG: phosphate ABC transporter permease subunit PstC [Pseudomonadales bacterium]|nr:phosphate ABC transporter permease subunit PstC [Pseudomonadales bacterium]
MSRSNIDRLIEPPLRLAGFVCAAILLLILLFLMKEAAPVLSSGGWRLFVADTGWYPMEGLFGILPMLVASLVVMLGAIVLAAPIGLGCAIFLQYYAPPVLAKAFRLLLSLLAGMPSVVLGLWGLTVLVPLISGWQPPGTSLLTAIIVLALMVVPTMALASASALSSVPDSLMNGAAALGLTLRARICFIALSAARTGIRSAALLSMARAIGETMVVLMVAGNVVQYPSGLFEPVRVLTANIALEMAYATDLHRAGLFASGLLLTLIVLALAWMAARSGRRDTQYG